MKPVGKPLRIGILGAARIAPMALIWPARRFPDVEVRAVAARAPKRATAFAIKHRIPRVHQGYEGLLDDPEIDAIYNPLPNALHAEWTIKALEAGKHVLCEKPFASDAREAQTMADAAVRTGRVLMEAFHYRYHPLFGRMKALLDQGAVGEVRRLEATFCIVLPWKDDIRFDPRLAGGALMDTGCYTVHLLRHLAGAEPTIERAHGLWTPAGVDRWMQADLRFPGDRMARLTCALASRDLFRISASVEGSAGRMSVLNFIAPQLHHRLTVSRGGSKTVEHVPGASSYASQLRAFVGAVRRGDAVPTNPADAVANMRVIDAIYTAAGRPPRP